MNYSPEQCDQFNMQSPGTQALMDIENSQRLQKEYEQKIRRSLINEKEEIRIRFTSRIQKARKELLLVCEGQKQIQLDQGFQMIKNAFSKILDLYFEKILSQFLYFYTEKQLFRKAKLIETTIRKNLSYFVKMLKDHFKAHDKDQESISCSGSSLNPIKKSKKFSVQTTKILKEYLMSHFDDPYPSGSQKQRLSQETGLTISQVNNWFVNTRERIVKKYYKKESMGNLLKMMGNQH